jgi:hypothetical protein
MQLLGGDGQRKATVLRLLAAEPLPPLPDASELLPTSVRRPGELHEAVPVDPETARWLSGQAMRLGVGVDTLASVLLEASMVAQDLGWVRFENVVPAPPKPSRYPLTAAEAAYLRSLTIVRARPRVPSRPPVTVALPVRLIPRLDGQPLDGRLRSVAPELALGWEALAVAEGRSLAECVLIRAAGAS